MALIYNGISFSHAQTQVHINGSVKDPSGTDQLFTEIYLKVKSLIYIDGVTFKFLPPAQSSDRRGNGLLDLPWYTYRPYQWPNVPPNVAPPNPAPFDPNKTERQVLSSTSATITRIRHMLTAPRKPLYWDMASNSFYTPGNDPQVTPIIWLKDGLDDNNGPIPDPDAFSIVYTTPDCLEVTWACKIYLRDCETTNNGVPSPSNVPLSLRWQDSITFDETWKATYERRGTLIISSLSTLSIDDYRRMRLLAPAVRSGFRRTNANYVCSRNGLSADFSFRDVQVRYTPPDCAVEMNITQSESFPTIGGMKHGEVTVEMRGKQNASVRDLSMWALTIMKARMWAAEPNTTKTGQVISQAVVTTKETIHGVDVVVKGEYKIPPKPQRASGSSLVTSFTEGALVGGVAGFIIGGPAGAAVGATVGGIGNVVVDSFAGGSAAPTGSISSALGRGVAAITGRDPTKTPLFPWIGVGTSPPDTVKSSGFAPWATPGGVIDPPTDGYDFATNVPLFAAILQDPCGGAVANASTSPTARLSTSPSGGEIIGPISVPSPVGGVSGSTNPSAPTFATLVAQSVSDLANAYDSEGTTLIDDDSLFYYDGAPGAYDYWQCVSEYHDDPGVVVIPTCNPDGTNIAINHSSEMIWLVKRWGAMRTGAAPNLPPRDSKDPNMVYVYGMVAPREMKVAPDGVSVQYEVQGVYCYQALNASLVDKAAEIPPFLSVGALAPVSTWVSDYELDGGPPSGTSTGGQNASSSSSGTSFLPGTGTQGTPVLGSGQLIPPTPL